MKRKDNDSSEQDLEQIQKDIATLYRLVKNIDDKLKKLQTDIDFRNQADRTPPFALSDPPRPSPLGKSLGDWHERMTNKTNYPIAKPQSDE